MTKPILLIDQDGVQADYYGGFLQRWRREYPKRNFIEPDKLTHFYLETLYHPDHKDDIFGITQREGFFEFLPPIEGAIETMQRILAEGKFEPFICTSPDFDAEDHSCSSEKVRWVEKHLGREWVRRMILTKDKTLVRGDFLIDDKPTITGVSTPAWQHVVFNHSYNQDAPGIRLNGWKEWDKVEPVLLDQHRRKQLQLTANDSTVVYSKF